MGKFDSPITRQVVYAKVGKIVGQSNDCGKNVRRIAAGSVTA